MNICKLLKVKDGNGWYVKVELSVNCYSYYSKIDKDQILSLWISSHNQFEGLRSVGLWTKALLLLEGRLFSCGIIWYNI